MSLIAQIQSFATRIATEFNTVRSEMVVRVEHGATASTARPTGVDCVIWIGSVEPTNMADGDLWFEIT